jgi:lycopene cyclase domain-containing protein
MTEAHVEYAVLLAFAWASLIWADLRFDLGVLRRRRRLLGTLAVCLPLCLLWDSIGVHFGVWASDPARVLGLWPLPGVPIEELFLLALIVYAAIVLWQVVQRVDSGARTGRVRR